MKWFARWSDALVERHEFQFGELVSFNPEYDCLYLSVPITPPLRRRSVELRERRPQEERPRR